MKLSLALVAVSTYVGLVAGTKNRKLRSGSPSTTTVEEEDNKVESKPPVTFETRIQVGGLSKAMTPEELATLDTIVIDTFNQAYQSVGHEITQSESRSSIMLLDGEGEEDGATMIANRLYIDGDAAIKWWFGYDDWLCRICIYDDWDDWWTYYNNGMVPKKKNMMEFDLMSQAMGKYHASFEKKLCKKLRASGTANFADAKECSVSFLEHVGGASFRVPHENTYDSMNGMETKAQISMLGLVHEPQPEELRMLEYAIVKAHKRAFATTPYSLKSFETDSTLDAGNNWWVADCEDCNVQGNDPQNAVTLIFANVTPESDLEKGKDFTRSKSKLDLLHRSFETAVCTQLQASGVANFANVHDCNFRFVYHPVAEATTKSEIAMQQETA